MFYLKNDRHLKLLYGITVLIKKTHNNMSIYVFPLSHQAGTILATHMFKSYMLFRHRCSSAFLLSILLLSRHSNRQITMVLPTTKVRIVMQKIHPLADMPSLFLAFHFIADFNKSVDKQ